MTGKETDRKMTGDVALEGDGQLLLCRHAGDWHWAGQGSRRFYESGLLTYMSKSRKMGQYRQG